MPVDINDMTDLSEILVVKERRKSRDERRKSGNGSPKRVSNESAGSKESKDSAESSDSKQSKNNSESSSDNSDKIQERLSLDTFFRSVKDKSVRTSWKRHLKLLDDVDHS